MFDPYHKWLGILLKYQPPHHYRLLSLEPFESDLDVIEGAADRLMSFVRQYQSGENASDAAKILNELAIARLCLLKPATKAAYDAKLRQQLAPPEPEFPELPFSIDEPPRKKRTKKSAKSKASGIPQPLMIGGIATVVVVFVAIFLLSGGRKPVNKSINSNSVATPKKTIVEPVIGSETTRVRESTVANKAAAPISSSSNPRVVLASQTVKPGEWVDLLEWTEGVDWAGRGSNWNNNIEGKPNRDGITPTAAREARFPLSAIIDGNYEMEVQFTRYEGNGDVSVHFPVGIHTMRMLLGTGGGAASQLDFFDRNPSAGVYRRPAPISNNQPHNIRIRVFHDGEEASINVDLDDVKDYFKWDGAYASLTDIDPSPWRTTILRHPWIGSYENKHLTFQKVRVRMLSGTIVRDSITPKDRLQDLKNGFIRLVGEEIAAVQTHNGYFAINQMMDFPPKFRWPRITPDFKFCDDFYGAHAPCRLKCPIPTGAKSFSVVAYNCASGSSKYRIFIDGKRTYDSAEENVVIIKVEIPDQATLLELVADPVGDNGYDHVYWCFPRFHSVNAGQVTDNMLDSEPGPLAFSIAESTVGNGMLTRNEPIAKSPPVHFRDAVPCHEFIFAHAPSSVTYAVREGMSRFTAVGSTPLSNSAKFEVWADGQRIYESPQAGLIPIDVKLPPGTKLIELKVDHLGDATADHSYWCYPRLHRK